MLLCYFFLILQFVLTSVPLHTQSSQVDYKQLPGFYPHAAGQIASHGPYTTVADIYKIPGITANDKAMFKKYEKELTVLPPGRMFKERINQRQST
jgi:photosystem II PsbU protein